MEIYFMTVETSDLIVKAKTALSVDDSQKLEAYIATGGAPLATSTALSFFQLFLNGSDLKEVHRLNKAFPYESVLWAYVKYDWETQKTKYMQDQMEQIRTKVVKATLDTTSLVTDLLAAAQKKHGDKLKKYLQTGNEADLGDALNVRSINELLKTAEALQKITGQDKTVNVNNKTTFDVNVGGQVGVTATGAGDLTSLSPEAAAQVLAAIASDMRKKRDGK
jgi:hypothetical protein